MIKKSFAALTAAGVLLAGGHVMAQPTIDGEWDGNPPYTDPANAGAGINNNENFGFGSSAMSSFLWATDDDEFLYIMVEGNIHSGNRLFIFIDSDDNPATGVSDTIPSGTFGESGAISLFSEFPQGGYDTVIAIGCSSNPADELFLTLIAYDAAGALEWEAFIGSITGPGGDVSGTLDPDGFRGISNPPDISLALSTAGPDTGDIQNSGQGIEIAFPRVLLPNGGGDEETNYRIFVGNVNGDNNFWSDSFIPELSAPGNLGGGSPGDIDALEGLETPQFEWQSDFGATSVADWMMLAD